MAAPRRRVAQVMGGLVLAAVLAACASTIAGDPKYVGAGPVGLGTTQSSMTEPPSTESSTGGLPTETSGDPAQTSSPFDFSVAELQACTLIPLSDLDAFTQFNTLADEASPTQDERNVVAAAFDAAATETQGYIDPLAPGAVRDAAQAYHDAQITVRDGLTAGSDVTTQIILDQQDVLSSACGF